MPFKIIQKLQFRRLHNKKHFTHASIAWQDIKSFILFISPHTSEEATTLTHFIDKLKKHTTRIKIVEFLKSKKEPSLLPYMYERTRIDSSHTNLLGIPKSSAVDGFIDQHFDVSIDLTDKDNVAAQYLGCGIDITMRVGIHDGNWDCYELVIPNIYENINDENLLSIIHYLQKIKP